MQLTQGVRYDKQLLLVASKLQGGELEPSTNLDHHTKIYTLWLPCNMFSKEMARVWGLKIGKLSHLVPYHSYSYLFVAWIIKRGKHSDKTYITRDEVMKKYTKSFWPTLILAVHNILQMIQFNLVVILSKSRSFANLLLFLMYYWPVFSF